MPTAETEAVVLTVDRHPPVSLNAVLSMNRWDRSRHNRLWKDEAAAAWMQAREPLLAWYRHALKADWRAPADVKRDFGSASILRDGRVVEEAVFHRLAR